jgi:hypothetical protein
MLPRLQPGSLTGAIGGDRYGGWITSAIVGLFTGLPARRAGMKERTPLRREEKISKGRGEPIQCQKRRVKIVRPQECRTCT